MIISNLPKIQQFIQIVKTQIRPKFIKLVKSKCSKSYKKTYDNKCFLHHPLHHRMLLHQFVKQFPTDIGMRKLFIWHWLIKEFTKRFQSELWLFFFLQINLEHSEKRYIPYAPAVPSWIEPQSLRMSL